MDRHDAAGALRGKAVLKRNRWESRLGEEKGGGSPSLCGSGLRMIWHRCVDGKPPDWNCVLALPVDAAERAGTETAEEDRKG